MLEYIIWKNKKSKKTESQEHENNKNEGFPDTQCKFRDVCRKWLKWIKRITKLVGTFQNNNNNNKLISLCKT